MTCLGVSSSLPGGGSSAGDPGGASLRTKKTGCTWLRQVCRMREELGVGTEAQALVFALRGDGTPMSWERWSCLEVLCLSLPGNDGGMGGLPLGPDLLAEKSCMPRECLSGPQIVRWRLSWATSGRWRAKREDKKEWNMEEGDELRQREARQAFFCTGVQSFVDRNAGAACGKERRRRRTSWPGAAAEIVIMVLSCRDLVRAVASFPRNIQQSVAKNKKIVMF